MVEIRQIGYLTGFFLLLFLGGCAGLVTGKEDPEGAQCPQAGEWLMEGHAGSVSLRQVLELADEDTVVLLGERHDRMAEHQWQLHTLAAFHGRFDRLAVGYEMFARDQQGPLDKWVEGHLSQEAFLEQVAWEQRWGLPFELYEPLLTFNRLQQVPAVALNVERELVSRIGQEGWEAVPADERHQISPAAEPPEAYRAYLARIADKHGPEPASQEQIERFIRAQGVWDRAMAEGLAELLGAGYGPVVGIVGRGHVVAGHGIPHQLNALGVDAVVTLLPWSDGDDCLSGEPPPADALYGLPDLPRGED